MPFPRRLVAALAIAAHAASAQPIAPDTTRALGEVVVGGVEARGAGVERVPVAGVLTRDPVAVADVVHLVPSATAPTHSRGETLVYGRGAGARQTAVLLDGAPLTVPWDRRLDLGLVPAGVVGAVDVVRGPASLAWGPNAAGGAVDLVPRALGTGGALTEAEASGGLPTRGRLAATHLRRRGPWQVGVAADASVRRGDALAAPLPFSQADAALRTNTDRRSASALARVAGEWAGRRLAVTLLHVSATQGVAPEGHLDPHVDRVRFWRIPSWRQTTLVARGQTAAGPLGLDATVWGGAFAQTVRPFESAAYDAPRTDQDDDDRSAGARLVGTARLGRVEGRVIATGLGSVHRQTEAGATETFRSAEGRVAAEVEGGVGRAQVLAGVGLDAFAPLETAGREAAGSFWAPALTARVAAPVGEAEAWAGIARAARFPTMRELFGEALGRFVLNPGLRPETTWQAEAGARVERPRWEARAVAFTRRTAGAIEQDVLDDGRRRRVNLGGSRALGVEASAGRRRGPLRLDASGTLLHLRGWADDRAKAARLPERPGALGRLAAVWLPPTGWTLAAEVLAAGPAVSLGPDGAIALPGSVRLGGRVGYRWTVGRGLLAAFARVDNATDALHLPQAGLPAPGREVRVGLRWVR